MVAVIYLAMSLPLSHLVRRLEAHMRRGRPRERSRRTYLGEWMPQLLVAAAEHPAHGGARLLPRGQLGLVLALARLSPRRCVARCAGVYVEVVRGAPALAVLFLIYFGLPSAGIVLPAFAAAVIGLGLNGAAYVSEIYRAGIAAIHRGQREAAQAIGMTRAQVMRYIVLPQALRIVAAAARQLRDRAAEGHLGRVADRGAGADAALARSQQRVFPADGDLRDRRRNLFRNGGAAVGRRALARTPPASRTLGALMSDRDRRQDHP